MTTTTINRSTKLNQQLQPPPVRAPQEAARSPLDRVGVLDEALLKIADEHLQLDGIDALLALPDLSESDCARTESGPRLHALGIDDSCGLVDLLRADGLRAVLPSFDFHAADCLIRALNRVKRFGANEQSEVILAPLRFLWVLPGESPEGVTE
jgi:hypothetical protein